MCVVPEGLRSLSLLTHPSTTPARAKPARFGDSGEAVGYLNSVPQAGLLFRAWALILSLNGIFVVSIDYLCIILDCPSCA